MAVTIQDDMAELIELLPKEQQGEFALALIQYGCNGAEPDKSAPWFPTFFAIKSRLEMSRKAHTNGQKGAQKRWNEETADNQAIIAPYDGVPIAPYDAENENENENENEREKKGSVRGNKTTKRFSKPSIDDLKSYIAEKGYSVKAEKFWNYYEANGWRVGKNPMKSWHSAVAMWQQRESEGVKNEPSKSNPFANVHPDATVYIGADGRETVVETPRVRSVC